MALHPVLSKKSAEGFTRGFFSLGWNTVRGVKLGDEVAGRDSFGSAFKTLPLRACWFVARGSNRFPGNDDPSTDLCIQVSV